MIDAAGWAILENLALFRLCPDKHMKSCCSTLSCPAPSCSPWWPPCPGSPPGGRGGSCPTPRPRSCPGGTVHYIVYIPYQIITTTFNTYQCLANNTGPNNTKRGGTYYTTLNHILQNNEPQKIGLLCTQHTLCIVPQNIDLQITIIVYVYTDYVYTDYTNSNQ